MSGRIGIKLGADTGEFTRKMKKSQSLVSGFGKSIMRTAGIAGGVYGITQLAKNSLQAASNMETLKTSFEIMQGSAALASQTVQDLTEFTAKTPFQLDGVANAARQLLAAGVNTRDLQDELKTLGDLASVTNVPLGDMAKIYSKAMNKGKLQAEELNQLSERGIPIMKELAKMYGKTKAEIFDMASKGKIHFEDLQTAMRNMTSEGGIAHGAMQKLSETSAGLYSTFQDNLNLVLADLGENILPAVNWGLGKMISLMGAARNESLESLQAEEKMRRNLFLQYNQMLKGATEGTRRYNNILERIKESKADWAKAQQDVIDFQKREAAIIAATREQTEKNEDAVISVTTAEEKRTKSLQDQIDEFKKAKKAQEALTEEYVRSSQVLGQTFMTLNPMSVDPLETTEAEDPEVKIRNVTKSLEQQQEAWKGLSQGILLSTQGLTAFAQLAAASSGADAANRRKLALFQAALAIPQAFLSGLITSGGNPGMGAAYASIAAVQAGAIASTPVPSFDIGTTSFRGGAAILHPGETISNLPQGTKVLSKGMSGDGGPIVMSTRFDGVHLYLEHERTGRIQNFIKPQ